MDFKDYFDYALAHQYADAVAALDRTFDRELFNGTLGSELLSLEMKGRVNLIADSLWIALAKPYGQAIEILLKVTLENMSGFPVWVTSQVVEKYGVDDFEQSMEAIYRLTQLFTGEFAIRPFLDKYPQQTFTRLNEWVNDNSVDVRRLTSEGSRPRLPWAARVGQLLVDPAPILLLLAQLKDDPAEYVRRSVANNLNDISKDHPEVVVETVRHWLATSEQSKELDGLARHALRSLLKNGNSRALALMGFDNDITLEVKNFSASPKGIVIGDDIKLNCKLSHFNETPQRLMIDIILFWPGANGNKNRKVFKWSKRNIPKAGSFTLDKRLSLKPSSVRKVYPGKHEVHLVVNGQNKGVCFFDVAS